MINILICDENGKNKCDSIDNIDMQANNVIWIDCENPTSEEMEKLAKIMKIDMEEIVDSLDIEEHARIEVSDEYISIIYTVPHVSENEMETASFGIFMKNNVVLTIHKIPVKALETFSAMFLKNKHALSKKIAGRRYVLLADILDFINKDYLRILTDIDNRLEELNDEIFRNPQEKHVHEILEHRKTLIYFSRALLANRDVLILIKRGYLPDMEEEDVENFVNLYSDMLQLIDMTSTFKELSNSTMNLYHSSLSNNMNILMKKLSFLATLFVVPTLITGLYGMNFTNMPFLHDPFGFYYSLLAMVLLIIGLTIYLKRNDI